MARKTKVNNITTPELLSNVCNENKELLLDFEDYLRSVQRSELTIFNYKSDIQIAWIWNLQHNNNIPFTEWTKRQIIRYQNWLLNENKNSPARIKRLKASLSSLSNYIENVLDEDYPDFRNIVNKVESPVGEPVREKTVFTNEQIQELLSYLIDHKNFDKACVLALALYSGRRKSELLRFKTDDFSDDKLICGGSLYKTGKIKTKGRGINGKQLECFCLAKQFKPYLDMWISFRKENNIHSVWLFPSKANSDEPMNVASLNSWARSFSKIMNKDFYWHSIRHMTVTMFTRAGIPDSVIQQYIGWSDISMVSVYSDIEADEQLGMYFTENGIVKAESKDLTEI